MSILDIFFTNFFIFLYICATGIVFEKIFFQKNHTNLLENFFLGIVFLSFISLLLNFFFPLNSFVNSFVIIVILTIYFTKCNPSFNIKYIYYSAFISALSTLILYKSNIYRPDAGLYHLPFIKILNDEKIVFGLSNIHFRFGHISILQYVSAHFNNYITNENAINAPSALISISFLLYVLNEIKKNIKYNFYFLFCFFVFIFSIIYLDRYSDYGNDASGFVFAILAIISVIKYNVSKKNINFFYLTSIFSSYCFLIKSFLIIFLTLPLLILNFKKFKEIIIDKKIIFIIIFLFMWVGKNIINTGCLIYPMPTLCISSLEWTDVNSTKYFNEAGEAAAKGFLALKDQNKKKFEKSYILFNTSFNWLSIWSKTHLKKIFEKNVIYLSLLLLYFLYYQFYIQEKISKPTNNFKKLHKTILLISFMGLILWFLKFPLLRYGTVFLFLVITLLFLFCIKKSEINHRAIHNKHIKFLSLLLVIFVAINVKRITKDFSNSAWPNIHRMGEIVNYKKIIIDNKEIYTFADSECMYTKTLCTHLNLQKINYREKNYYKIFLKKSKSQ